ncbi:MAG: DUF4349 domain-containing protein, partial [Acidimicrobiia bacterium]
MRPVKLIVPVMMVVLAVGVVACGGSASSTEVTAKGRMQATDGTTDSGRPATTAPPASPEEAPAGETIALPGARDRKVIRSATISIEANDTRAAHDAVQRLVDEAGGFIQAADIADPGQGQDQPRITMTIRVPADSLTRTLEAIAGLGSRVVSQSQQGQDVTEEYVDVEARITNLTALEVELRALLAEVRKQPQADPAKLLQVFDQISQVRGQIEQLEGRRQVLDDLTSLATVDVSIAPTPALTPVVAEEWQPLAVARGALQDLVGALQRAGDLAIRLVVYVLPIALVVLAVPALVVWRLRRRFARPT